MTLTLTHDRKMRRKKRAEQDRQDVIKSAEDYAKRRGIVSDGSPKRQIEILSNYVGGLENIRDEMLNDYGDLSALRGAIRRIETEIKWVLEEIARAKIGAIKPD